MIILYCVVYLYNLPNLTNYTMNHFGGDWTKAKIEILVEYAQAYLTVMKSRTYWKLLYFDGFAGSGSISNDKSNGQQKVTIGAARRIIEINEPRSFDEYYFVEKNPKNFKALKENTKDAYPAKTIYCAKDDCNLKLQAMADYLQKDSNVGKIKVLAYIDPYGMQLEWKSIERLKGLDVDAWILVPTGLGMNRLLVKNGKIDEVWMSRLETFLGLDRTTIFNHFYKQAKRIDLFGDTQVLTYKEAEATEKSSVLYKKRLAEVFTHVSTPYKLCNSAHSVMYHLFFVSNNTTGKKIANDIVKKYQRLI